MPPERVAAFAPGRVNLIGEHTDYNQGLALPFAIAQGVTVHSALRATGEAAADASRPARSTSASGTRSCLREPPPREAGAPSCAARSPSWSRPGVPLAGARLEIGGDVPRGAGLSSSAALEVALCLALLELAGRAPDGRSGAMRLASPACARAWRTSGSARRQGCSTSSRACSAPPTRRC